MQAEIITIGDEILIGQITDTNSAWMARELNQIGVYVAQITSISDDKQAIIEAVDRALSRYSLVLITGGLGPTNDDITKKTLCDYYGTELVRDDKILAMINDRLTRRGVPMNELNCDQALVPKDCDVIANNYGTAPGMWFERDNRVLVSMPGVPYEMKGLMRDVILGRIAKKFIRESIIHKTIMVQGLAESVLAMRLSEWEMALPQCVKLAYLPSPGVVRLRLSLQGADEQELEKIAHEQISKLQLIIPEHIFGYDDEPLEQIVGAILRERKQSMATAESCTGGNIAHVITSHAGSSDFFKGGVVSYSNEVKESLLGVPHEDLLSYGAVSEQVVRQMAQGARSALNADYSIATSGVAGPSGGTDEKPVGTVWIAVAGPQGCYSEKFIFSNQRSRNIRMATLTGLNLLRRILIGEIGF